ncbi:hypothetical protein TWF696_000365 [Orbilia brochopaga]|uniref:Uncharacterized protein n=1 Tax=Orbilia brochopaga TaxID=3140254 RepID=A0AAV9VDI3_9PEZI
MGDNGGYYTSHRGYDPGNRGYYGAGDRHYDTGKEHSDPRKPRRHSRRSHHYDSDSSDISPSDNSHTPSYTHSSGSSRSYYQPSDPHRRSSSARRQYASDQRAGLTRASQPQQQDSIKRSKTVSDSDNRKKRRSRGFQDSDSDSSDDSDSGSDSGSDENYSDDDDDSSDKETKGDMSVASSSYHKRKKTRLEKKVDEVLDALGLLHIKHSPSKRQLSSPDPEKYAQQKQALQAAVTAAAIEAWRSHSRPGGFNAQKVVRVIVAAIAAGGVDILMDNHPGHEKMRDIAEAVVGGLATSKTLGGKITHRREGGAQGKMIDGFIALAASKMVRPPKPEEVERRKKAKAKRSQSAEPSKRSSSGSRRR